MIPSQMMAQTSITLIPPPRGADCIHRSLANDKQPCRQFTVDQPALVNLMRPYVRTPKFTEWNETVPSKRGQKQESKNNNDRKAEFKD